MENRIKYPAGFPDSEAWDSAKKAWLMRASGSSYREIHETTHLYKNAGCYTTFYFQPDLLGRIEIWRKGDPELCAGNDRSTYLGFGPVSK